MIYFKKDGTIFRYEYSKEDKSPGEEIKTSLIPYLTEVIELEDGTTFDSFMYHLFFWHDDYNTVFASQLGHYSLLDWHEEFCKDPVEKHDMMYLKVSHGPIQIIASGPNKFGITEVDIGDDFHGWGNWGDDEKTIGTFGLDFLSINELRGYELKLDKEVEFFDMNTYESICKMERYFSVYDVIGTILNEISFYGSPKQRDAKSKEVLDRLHEAMDTQTIKNTNSFSSVKEFLDKLAEDNDEEKPTTGPSLN